MMLVMTTQQEAHEQRHDIGDNGNGNHTENDSNNVQKINSSGYSNDNIRNSRNNILDYVNNNASGIVITPVVRTIAMVRSIMIAAARTMAG